MKWTITTPATDSPLDWEALKKRLKVDDDERAYVMELAAECVAHAEFKMQTSLMPRTITAQFWADDYIRQDQTPFITNYGIAYALPRGPVISVTSVKNANNVDVTYKQYTVGNSDRILLPVMQSAFPITVVYQAGYASADAVPDDIKRVIKLHVATSYMLRESVSPLTLSPVESIDNFYRDRGRGISIA